MSVLRIAPAGPDAFQVIAALYARIFDDHWPETSVRELLQAFGTWALIATVADPECGSGPVPVGFLLGRVIVDEGEILSVGTAPEHRRAGAARTLLNASLARMRDSGARKVFLEVGIDNPAAFALYSAVGFKEVGRRENYYRRSDGTDVDALILQKSLH